MPRRFYVAWGLVVALAAILPVFIPYFIWPPQSYEGAKFDTDQAQLHWRYADVARLLPSSVETKHVDPPDRNCHSGPADRRLRSGTVSNVVFHGAYGIPFASFDVSCTSETGLSIIFGPTSVLAVLAWFAGMLVVSIPFWLLQQRRRENVDRSYWFYDMPVLR